MEHTIYIDINLSLPKQLNVCQCIVIYELAKSDIEELYKVMIDTMLVIEICMYILYL